MKGNDKCDERLFINQGRSLSTSSTVIAGARKELDCQDPDRSLGFGAVEAAGSAIANKLGSSRVFQVQQRSDRVYHKDSLPHSR